MQADDDVPTLQQLLERNRVLQHDFEQAEHHRQTDDDRDPYDAAEDDLVDWVRKYHHLYRFGSVQLVRPDHLHLSAGFGGGALDVTRDPSRRTDRILLDAPGDGGS